MRTRRHPRAWSWLLVFAILFATTLRAAHWHTDVDEHLTGQGSAHCSICLSVDRSPAPPPAMRMIVPALIETSQVVVSAVPSQFRSVATGAHRPRGPPAFLFDV